MTAAGSAKIELVGRWTVKMTAMVPRQAGVFRERVMRRLGRTATGAYPDELAYDPANGTIWITNEPGGSETAVGCAH